MTPNKTPPHIKLDERNHIDKPLHSHLNKLDWDIIPLMQDLLTGKKRVTSLLTEPQEAGA
jgi:hypothetical protein